jgi:hypothetical protein
MADREGRVVANQKLAALGIEDLNSPVARALAGLSEVVSHRHTEHEAASAQPPGFGEQVIDHLLTGIAP